MGKLGMSEALHQWNEYPRHNTSFPPYMDSMDLPVLQCSDSSFCCGDTSIASQCCRDNQGVHIAEDEEATSAHASKNPSTSLPKQSHSQTLETPLPTSGATITSKTLSTKTTVVTKTAAPGHSNTIAPAIGGSVSGVAGLIISASVIWLLLRRRSRDLEKGSSISEEQPSMAINQNVEELGESYRPHEMDGRERLEMQT
ncbi:MAG: hypothetical protein Q9190_003149 [Brigantiaea leucoxantha]